MPGFRKISAFLLALLVLFGSSSFTVSMHFCMEQMESITFFNDTRECDMMTSVPPCHMEDDQTDDKHEDLDGCCEDRVNLIEGQDEFKGAGSVTVPSHPVIAVLYTVIFHSLLTPSLETYNYQTYFPPVIERDIPILVQSFLL